MVTFLAKRNKEHTHGMADIPILYNNNYQLLKSPNLLPEINRKVTIPGMHFPHERYKIWEISSK